MGSGIDSIVRGRRGTDALRNSSIENGTCGTFAWPRARRHPAAPGARLARTR